MSYDDCVVKIEKLANGFEVEVFEPPEKKPRKSSEGFVAAPSPWKGYVFQSADEVIQFLTERLPKIKTPGDTYSEGFVEATAED